MDQLSREEIIQGLAAEHAAFADLVRSLSEADWTRPTRCAGWQVRDVAGHVVANAVESLDGSIGRFSPDEQAAARRDQSPQQAATTLNEAGPKLAGLLDHLGPEIWDSPSPVPPRTIGQGILTLWYDTYVHADDIRDALGMATVRGPGLIASVHWLVGELARKDGAHVTLALDGVPPLASGGDGPTVTGDPLPFVLAATGRRDPACLGLPERINVHAPA